MTKQYRFKLVAKAIQRAPDGGYVGVDLDFDAPDAMQALERTFQERTAYAGAVNPCMDPVIHFEDGPHDLRWVVLTGTAEIAS